MIYGEWFDMSEEKGWVGFFYWSEACTTNSFVQLINTFFKYFSVWGLILY